MQNYKLVVLGQGGVGKSAITIQFTSSVFAADYDPTIEDAYRVDTEVDGEVVGLDIVDTAGQEVFSNQRDGYMRNGDGFLLVYSLTKQSSFIDIPKLSEKIKKVKGSERHVPIVLVGNKCDIADQREVSNGEEELIAHQLSCPYFETSAKVRVNIKECFHELVREINKSRMELEKEASQKKASEGCCCVLL